MKIAFHATVAAAAAILCGCAMFGESAYRFAVVNKTSSPLGLVTVESKKVKGFLAPTEPNETKTAQWTFSRMPSEVLFSWIENDAIVSNSVRVAESLPNARHGKIFVTILPSGQVKLSQGSH